MPLRPSNEELQRWPLLERISMWGDEADGRVVQRAPSSEYKGTPSEWVSKFLGYEVVLVQFSPEKERDAFPIFKPPSEIEVWEEDRRKQLESRRGIEFQVRSRALAFFFVDSLLTLEHLFLSLLLLRAGRVPSTRHDTRKVSALL